MPRLLLAGRLLGVVSIVVALAGCGSPASTSPAVPSTSAMAVSASPRATTSPPETSPPETSPPASPTPLVWSELERALRDGIREDAAVRCSPRHGDLPPATIAAVECQPQVASVSRVGFYYFESSEQASAAYMNRIRDEGLNLDDQVRASRHEGPMWDCADGDESASIKPDPACEQFREAGFINSSGYANYRAVFDRLYIGVLGTTDDVEALSDWAWSSEHWPQPPPGEMGTVPEVPTLYEGELAWPWAAPPDQRPR